MIPAARAALESVGGVTLLLTEQRGDEVRCTRDALAAGATTIAVLGGDGTISQVGCELIRAQSDVPMAILGAGTGNDFAKSVGAPIHDYRAMAHLVAQSKSRRVDAGRVEDNYFLNSCGFGLDAHVVELMEQPRRWRGKSAYTAIALQQLFQYPGFSARVSAPAAPELQTFDGNWLTIVFANGSWFGGTYRIAPEASIADGALDAIFISDAPTLRRAIVFARALAARHIGQREVAVQRNTEWMLEFPSSPVYQTDGELRKASDKVLRVEIVPSALRVVSAV